MYRRRIRLTVEWNLDDFPGVNHTAQDARLWLQRHLEEMIGYYSPVVSDKVKIQRINKGTWECEKSPDKTCWYDVEDSPQDNCIYCELPHERK